MNIERTSKITQYLWVVVAVAMSLSMFINLTQGNVEAAVNALVAVIASIAIILEERIFRRLL